MNTRGLFLSIAITLVSLYGYSQKVADKYFETRQYATAASIYQKTYDKGKADLNTLQKLGACYQKLNRYDEAAKYFEEAVQYDDVDNASILSYGELLLNQNKISEAKVQFNNYLARSGLKEEESAKGKALLKSCDSIFVWTSEPTEYQAENFDVLNSDYIEISPFPVGNKIYFTSDRIKGKSAEETKDLDIAQKIFNIYVYDPNADEKIALFTVDINSSRNTEGPAYFNDKGDRIIYTKVDKSGGAISQMKLQIAKRENDAWVQEKEFNRNNDNYSITNPVFTGDPNTIYFASDMPGGQGGFDIWKCTKKGLLWQKPENLGPGINTQGDEVPSFFSADKVLYFSSTFHPGFGGSDIFRTKLKDDGSWSAPKNMNAPFNSTRDDLGFVLLDKTTGYFSSNREGGAGLDDIYKFKKIALGDPEHYINLSGNFYSENGAMASKPLLLLDEDGVILRTMRSDKDGNFELKNVPKHESYKVLVDEAPENLPDNADVKMKNTDNSKETILERLGKGSFTFKLLDLESSDDLAFLANFDESGLPTITVFAQLKAKEGTSVANKKVHVVDADGNVLFSTTTDHLGKFNFEKLKIDEQYLFMLEESDDEIDIQIISETGEILGRTVRNKDGQYVYHKFTINPSDNPDVRGVFKFGNLPADGVTLMLVAEDDEILKLTKTDKNGAFEFTGLNSGASYKIQVDTNLEVPSNSNLFLYDKRTGMLMPVSKLANGTFNFETLAPIPPEELALMEEEDFVIEPKTDLKGQITSSSKEVPAGLKVQILDDNGKVVAVAETDGKGSFKFFNLPLEDQYLFSIPEDDPSYSIRILNDDDGLIGEAKKDNNNLYVYHKFIVNPSERPDIRGVFKYGNLPANNVRLNLVDEEDDVVQFATTNAMGEFLFKELRAGKKYKVRVDEKEIVPDNSNMYIQDAYTGLMLPVSKLANGEFAFETLAMMEAEELELVEENDETDAPKFSFFAQLFDIDGEALHEAGKRVNIYNKEGEILGTAVTDERGRFIYTELPLEEEYLMKMEEEDENAVIAIVSKDGKNMGQLQKNENGEFVFNHAEFYKEAEKKKKAEKLSSSTPVTAKKIDERFKPIIYFEFNSDQLNNSTKSNLDMLAKYMKGNSNARLTVESHTDSKGSDDFNMRLSAKRSQRVKSYLINNGVESSRITTNNYGERKLLNNCADGVECSESEHAKNRRVELKYTN